MNGADRIRKMIVKLRIMDEGEANATRIQYGTEYDGYQWGRGWHMQRFGRSEVSHIGDNIDEAIDMIQDWRDELDVAWGIK